MPKQAGIMLEWKCVEPHKIMYLDKINFIVKVFIPDDFLDFFQKLN